MRITGGSFGVNGKAYVGQDDRFYVQGAIDKSFAASDVISVETAINKETKFSVLSVIVGVPLLMLIGWFLFSIVGAIVGLILAVAGSFYAKKTISAQVLFHGGEKLTVEGWHSDIQNLVRFAAKR